ncbi:hypothetical protein [Desulfitobacterium sp.]|uniref:hypothetical protein n=1 Tax=Desulfitobacterium sp. TaxID=49981 RepID=UPI002BFC6C47|nr:hypothetical protein [Desulfitobacterium sp.]HVJ50773.1 hypothetical protein [Desulfitobacterium sp.]
MQAMRLMIPMDNLVKDCQGCREKDEAKVSTQILSFELADRLLRRYSGTWRITQEELEIHLCGVDFPLRFELAEGVLTYSIVRTHLLSRYDANKGVARLEEELIEDLALPYLEDKGIQDPLFQMLVKLIEIFHARCGLNIRSIEMDQETTGWEIFLCEDGPHGWISREGIAKNQFGEQVDLKTWFNLRPEKLASYVFGFNSFCKNYANPLKRISH